LDNSLIIEKGQSLKKPKSKIAKGAMKTRGQSWKSKTAIRGELKMIRESDEFME